MRKLNKVILFIFFWTLNFAIAQQSYDEVYSNLKSKIKDLKSIHLDFSVRNQSLKGKLFAKVGNKYQVVLNDRIITCNGKVIWNFSKSKNQVLMSNLEDLSSQASLQNVLFGLVAKYKPFALSKETNTKIGSSLLLKLKSDANNAEVDEVHVWMDIQENIKSIGANLNGTYEIWDLTNLTFNPNIQDSKFEFKIPEKVELIDLR